MKKELIFLPKSPDFEDFLKKISEIAIYIDNKLERLPKRKEDLKFLFYFFSLLTCSPNLANSSHGAYITKCGGYITNLNYKNYFKKI